ncbi:TonB-dependent receptor [Sphingobium sp.]|uniref:TonB-dependent receptor n=1 Tax=Sphingobium sp. TaxID=1912891 RepID=UPI002C0CDAE9|nr:TonB-dependent receptor [Sphingobium sp.]HUD90400.1 TonB-dependent receptor [Sphingobium sp.]
MSIKFSPRHFPMLLAGSALCGAMLASPAYAETPTPLDDAGAGLGEITVTAQKRETNLQKTPISISVLNAADLENRHVISLESLADGSIPTLRIAPMFSRSSALTVGMRGIGTLGDANQPSRDQGVGVYIDGVFMGRAQGLGSALYDVERIEVLKGPQGTLFGRNTEGGAISIITKKPSGEFGLRASVGASSFEGREASAHLDLPSIGNVSIKLDGLITRRGGTVDNPLAGEHDFNAYNKKGLHAGVLWEPTSNFNALYSFDISRDQTTPYYVQLLTKTTGPLLQMQPGRARVANIGVPQPWAVGKTHGHLLTLDWTVAPQIELKSISSFRKLSQTQNDNGAANMGVFIPGYSNNSKFSRFSLADVWQKQYSQEVQVIGTLPQVNFVVGGFYYHEDVNDNAWTPYTNQWNADGTSYTILPDPTAASPFPDRASHAETDSIGVFGQATWTPAMLNDIAHLTAGGRFTHDKKTGSLDKVNGVSVDYPLDASWDRFDPMVNLAVDLTQDMHVYGKWSTGYKAGGANSRSLTYRHFGPESVSTFEIGAKTEFFDRHARFNIAAYTSSYKDMQIDFIAPVLNSTRTTIETTNAQGNGRIKGIEADLTVTPLEGLTLTGSYAYTDVHLPPAPNPFQADKLVQVYTVYTPKHAASGAIDYEVPLPNATLHFHLDGNYSASQYSMASDPTKTGSSFIVNGRISLGDIRMPHGGPSMELALWSRNLFNEEYTFVKANGGSSLGYYGIFNDPRTVGVSATVKF